MKKQSRTFVFTKDLQLPRTQSWFRFVPMSTQMSSLYGKNGDIDPGINRLEVLTVEPRPNHSSWSGLSWEVGTRGDPKVLEDGPRVWECFCEHVCTDGLKTTTPPNICLWENKEVERLKCRSPLKWKRHNKLKTVVLI